MAVETRYVVVRNGEEVRTFVDKKSADEYDRMLDIAGDMSTLIEASGITLDEAIIEQLGIYLAENREEVLYALQAKKRPEPKSKKKVAEAVAETE